MCNLLLVCKKIMAGRYFFAWRMFESAKKQDERNYMACVRARARTSSDPLTELTEGEFMKRYRLTKKAFKYLCQQLKRVSGLKASQRVSLETKVRHVIV